MAEQPTSEAKSNDHGKDDAFAQLVHQLLDRQAESRTLDYKAAIAFGPARIDKGELLKDIIALANTRDGGNILIGVEQSAGQFVVRGVSDSQAASFDPTLIGTFAKNYCSVMPEVTTRVVELDGKKLVVLQIAEFRDEPILCIRDLHNGQNSFVLRAGSIYVRTLDAQSVAINSGEDMRFLLDLAVQKRGDMLLHQVRSLIGVPTTVSSAEPISAYNQEIKDATTLFEREKLSEPYWYVEIAPVDYVLARIESNAHLKEIRQESVVYIRGWDFPHVNHENDRAFEHGIESVTHWERFNEAHRFYRSGLFTWRGRLSEDSVEQYRGKLSYVSAIYSITEYLLFANRYAQQMQTEGKIWIRIGLKGLRDRKLRSEPAIFFEEFSTGADKFEQSYDIPVEELRASHLELANQASRRLFELYNLDIKADVIADWQKKLIERRL